MSSEWILVACLVVVFVFVLLRTKERGTGDESTIRILYRQAARYAVASLQDDSPVIKVLHANYAMGYFLALRDLASTDTIERVTGEDFAQFEHRITTIQDQATQALVTASPSLVPSDEPLLKAIYSS